MERLARILQRRVRMHTIELDVDRRLWDQLYLVAPLTLIGTLNEDGSPNLAPKHLATPLSFDAWFGFVCTPRHATWRNAVRTGEFTVSFPGPAHIVSVALAAAPRENGSKPSLQAIPMEQTEQVEGVVLSGCRLVLECTVDRTVDGLGDNSMVVGRVVAARAQSAALRSPDIDDADLISEAPLLAFLQPDRITKIENSVRLPFHMGFQK